MSDIEHCCKCDAETGRAGAVDDSLYLDNGDGPYCEDCWPGAVSQRYDYMLIENESLLERIRQLEADKADLEAENKALREKVDDLTHELVCARNGRSGD